MVWDFRLTRQTPIKLSEGKVGRYSSPSVGPLAMPGTYYVSLSKVENGTVTELAAPTAFTL